MLNPADLVDGIVTALQSIPDLVSAMGESANIKGHHFLLGTEASLQEAIYKMTIPGILVAWDGTLGGNYDAETLWKDKISIFVRMSNNATAPTVDGNGDSIAPIGFETLWHLIVNSPVLSTEPQYRLNILNTEIIPGKWTLPDLPNATLMTDEEGQQYLVIHIAFPQIGDQ